MDFFDKETHGDCVETVRAVSGRSGLYFFSAGMRQREKGRGHSEGVVLQIHTGSRAKGLPHRGESISMGFQGIQSLGGVWGRAPMHKIKGKAEPSLFLQFSAKN